MYKCLLRNWNCYYCLSILYCHGCKLASLSWCCQLLPCSDGEKFGSLMTNFRSFIVAATKNVQSDHIYVSVGIAGLSHVRARQCTNTPRLQNGCIFGSRDACFHVHMLLSTDTINIFISKLD